MAGKTTTSDTTSPTGTTSTTSSSHASGSAVPPPGTPPPSIVLMPPPPGAPGALGAASDGEDETVKSLRCVGIRAPKPYDPKRKPNFNAWWARVVFHMSVLKILDDKRTSSLLLLFDTDSFEAARHLGIQDNTDFDTAKRSSKHISPSRKRQRSSKKNSVFATKKQAKRSTHSRAISSSSDTMPTREKTLSSLKI